MPSADGDMTISELAIKLDHTNETLADFRNEVRNQFGQLVRADLYRAEQAAFDFRLKSVEKDDERREQERAANRRMVYSALLGAGLALVLAIVNLIVGGPE